MKPTPCTLGALALALAFALPAHAVTFEFDFNEITAPAGQPLQNKVPPGGVAKDGGAFDDTTWTGGTSFVDVFAGDLTATSAPTGYNIGQTAGAGPVHIGFGDDNSARGRFQYRNVADFAIGTTWISCLFDFNQDELGDGTDAFFSTGMTFAGNIQVTNTPVLGVTVEPSGTPGTPLTYVEWAPAGLRFDEGTTLKRGSQSADLALTPGDVHLLIAKLDEGGDTISVWINPADVTTEAAMGAPDLSAPLGITQITHLGWGAEGTGTNGPSSDPAEDFVSTFDAARISNQPNGFELATTTPDPILAQSAEDFGAVPPIDGSLNFGTTISSTGIARRIQFINNGPNNDITIEGVTILNDAGGVFTITDLTDFFGDPVVFPLVMIPTDTLDIEVTFDPAGATGGFTAELEVDTNEDSPANPQDKLVPVTANELATGQKISIPNANFESDPFNSGWATDRVSSAGGIAPGSSRAALLDQAGDGYLISSFPSASDVTVSFYFAAPETSALLGESNILFALRGPPFSRMVTIAYFPNGVDLDSTPGWYLFSTFWNRVPGLGTIASSNDADSNGSLDDPGDTRNIYKFILRANGFGDFGADYDIEVVGIDGAAGGGSESALIDFEQLNPNSALPNSIAFEQRDGQLGNAVGTGLVNQIGPWIDDVCVVAGTTPADPDLVVASFPSFTTLFNPSGPVSSQLILRNEGASDLSVSDLAFTDAHFSIVPAPAFPIVIAGGAISVLDVQFDPGVDFGVFTTDLTIESDDSVEPSLVLSLTAGAFNDGDKFFANGDFEADPFDTGWTNSGDVVSDAGLAAGSTTAAYVAGGENLQRDFVGTADFEAQFFFAVDDTASRQLNFYLSNDASVGANDANPAVNLRYEGGAWGVFDGAAWQALGQLTPVVAGPGNVYLLKVVGRGWGSAGATYDVFLSDVGGTTFTSAVTDLSFSHGGSPADGTPTGIRFRADTGSNPGFWVDDVCVTAGAPAVDDPNFSLVSSPTYPLQLDDNSAITSDLVVENTGINNTLTISGITIAGSANFTVLSALPVDVAPGAQEAIAIQFERGASPAGNFTAVATVSSNDATTPDIDVPLSANSLADSGKVVTNWDFETTGGGNPFDGWNTAAGTVEAVPGLIAGSTNAAHLAAGGTLFIGEFQGIGGVGNFVIDVYFAFRGTGRQFNFITRDADPASGSQMNIRYQGGIWYAFGGTPGQGGAWATLLNMNDAPLTPLEASIDNDGNGSLEDAGDTKNVYRCRVTCLGWGSLAPSFDLEIFDASGTLLGMAAGLDAFQNSDPTTAGGGFIDFSSQFGGGTGFWIDNACVTALEAVVTGSLVLTDVSSAGDDVTLTWNDIGASGFSIERSTDGETFTTIATGIAGTTFTDIGVLAGPDETVLYRVVLP